MTVTSTAEILLSKSQPLSRLNQPTRDLVLAARRERGLMLRATIGRAAGKLLLAFARRRGPNAARYERVDHRTA